MARCCDECSSDSAPWKWLNHSLLNYTVVEPNVDPPKAALGLINQDPNNRRDIQIGAQFTF